jgi:hypothetical protein
MIKTADMSNAFDQALEGYELLRAAEQYAPRRGECGSPSYREAWLRFRQHVRTSEDLRKWRPLPRAESSSAVSILKLAIKRAMQTHGAAMAYAQLVDPRSSTLRIVAQSGFTA